LRFAVLLCHGAAISFPGHGQTELLVSPSGVSAAGVETLTLQLAVDRLNASNKSSSIADGTVVRLAAGIYRLNAPLQLKAASSGQPDSPLVFQGPANGRATLSGARVVTGFKKVLDIQALARLPSAARSHVLQADLRSIGITEFGDFTRQGMGRAMKPGTLEVLFRAEPMPLARWPNQGYARIGDLPDGKDGGRFGIPGGHFDTWSREPDLQVHGYWFQDWADETIAIDKVDAKSGLLTLRDGKPVFGIKSGQRVFVQNALSELDAPGEWYLDRPSAILYFWPPDTLRDGDVEVSMLDSVLLVQGASHLQFKKIDFESVRGDAIIVSGGRDVVIANARVRNTGNRGVSLAGQSHRIIDSEIFNTGQGGINLSGGDRQSLAPGGLAADRNRLYNFSRLIKTYRPAIQIDGVGNRAQANVISDASHSAIIFYGNDHLIELNEIFNVALETGDVGAIYTGGDWTARGTVLRNNYLHDIHGPGLYGSRGIYLDDQTSGVKVMGNLFVRVDQAVFMSGGRDNLVENNVFVSSTPAIHLDARGLTWQREETQAPEGRFRKGLAAVPYDKPPYSSRYPGLANILQDEPGRPKRNLAKNNVVIDGKPFNFDANAETGMVIDRLFTERDVEFVAGPTLAARVRPLDFRLAPASGALARGFSPLPLAEMECTAAGWGLSQGREKDAHCVIPSSRANGAR
jgi:hypothetical protein